MAAWRPRARCTRSSHSGNGSAGSAAAGPLEGGSFCLPGALPRPLSVELMEAAYGFWPPHAGNWFTSTVARCLQFSSRGRVMYRGGVMSARRSPGARLRPFQRARPLTYSGLGNQPIYRSVGRAGELHAPLRNERGQQLIEQLHDPAVARELVRPEALDRLDPVLLDVAGDDAGKGAPQIGG